MRHRRLLPLLAFAAGLAATPAFAHAQTAPPSPAATDAPPPIPSPKPGADDPKIHKIAVQQFLAWQAGQVDRTLYTDDVNSQLNDDMMDRATNTLAHLGALQQTTFKGISKPKGLDVYVYHMVCANGAVDMDIGLDPTGHIALIYFE